MSQGLIEGRDYTVDPGGYWVFTREFLLRRGRCCGSGCRNCPYRPDTPQPGTAQVPTCPIDNAGGSDNSNRLGWGRDSADELDDSRRRGR